METCVVCVAGFSAHSFFRISIAIANACAKYSVVTRSNLACTCVWVLCIILMPPLPMPMLIFTIIVSVGRIVGIHSPRTIAHLISISDYACVEQQKRLPHRHSISILRILYIYRYIERCAERCDAERWPLYPRLISIECSIISIPSTHARRIPFFCWIYMLFVGPRKCEIAKWIRMDARAYVAIRRQRRCDSNIFMTPREKYI